LGRNAFKHGGIYAGMGENHDLEGQKTGGKTTGNRLPKRYTVKQKGIQNIFRQNSS
jgi:hypothetical protein